MNPESTPPTAPARKKKAVKKAAPPKKKAPPRSRENAAGDQVVPVLRGPGVTQKHWYWLGAFPSCPRGFVTIGGVTFCKMHETVFDREGGGRSERIPHLGQCLELSQDQVNSIVRYAKYGIIRFMEPPVDEDYEGLGLEALRSGKPRRGHPIRIPRPEEITEREKNGTPVNRYQEREWDEPLAYHVYAVPCEDQERPKCLDEFPEPLSETGITWPSEAA